MKILVVDDSSFARGIAMRELRALGVKEEELQQAADGTAALQAIETQRFDLALVDIVMNEIDGVAVLKKLKADSPNTKVIMCSSHSSPESLEELQSCGSDGFLLKPFSSEEFKNLVGPFLPK